MTNYNEAGQQYELLAAAAPWAGYGMLRPGGVAHVNGIRGEIQARLKSDPKDAGAATVSRLLDRLDGVLYHCHNALEYVREIGLLPKGSSFVPAGAAPPMMLMRNHRELGIECESILFHAAAALDSMSNMIARSIDGFQLLGTKTSRSRSISRMSNTGYPPLILKTRVRRRSLICWPSANRSCLT
jgi:hypothetical protein